MNGGRCTSEVSSVPEKHTINHPVGKLQVLDPEEEVIISFTGSTSRPNTAARKPGSAEIHCSTPSKQISLCAVKRLPQSHTSDYDLTESMLPRTMNSSVTASNTSSEIADKKRNMVDLSQAVQNVSLKKEPEDSSDDDDDSDETILAPTELCAEFLKAVMSKDYKVAQKLCQMILLYEPENPEAKAFSPLIEEMLQIECKQNETDEDSEETDEDSDETDEDSGETDEDSGETDEDSDETDEDSDETDEDSGETDEDSGETDEDSGEADEDSRNSDSSEGSSPRSSIGSCEDNCDH